MLDEAVRDDLLEAPVEREQRVTALELFFDLVFVFGFTQVTTVLSNEPNWHGLGHRLTALGAKVILAAVLGLVV